MNTTRFITENDAHHIKTLYSINTEQVGNVLTTEEVDILIQKLVGYLSRGGVLISMVFDENENPVAMYCGFPFPTINGWFVGLTKNISPESHFNKSAKYMAPGLDLMIEEMEKRGYYKFWMTAPEKHHNIRNMIMKKHSNLLKRYTWFDELVIPKGLRSDVQAWEIYRKLCMWSDVTVRMFVLDQTHRVEILRSQGHQDYKGTI
jgi:hypothetical protein